MQADSLVFTAGASDNASVARLKVEVKSVTIGFAFDSVVLDSTIAGTVTAVSRKVTVPLAAAYDGKQLRILVTATDGAGNVTTDSTGVTVAFADITKPTITISLPAPAGVPITVGDSVLVRVRVQDNRGVDSVGEVGIAHRGVDSLGTGTDVIRYTRKSIALPRSTDTTFSRYLNMIPTDSTPELVRILVSAKDSSGNLAVDTQLIQIVGGPHVAISRPAASASTAPGKSVMVEVDATKTSMGILVVGFATSGVVTGRDSIILTPTNGVLPTTYSFIKTYTIPALTANGPLTFTPFAMDSLHNVSGISGGVTINVSSAVVISVPPTISYSVGRRIETGDSITIEATSPAGIGRVGFTAKTLGGLLLSADSTTPALNGTLTDYTQRMSLKLPPTLRFPALVVVTPFAYDSGMTLAGRSVAQPETLTVVAGTTYGLPAGSQIADAIYNKNRNELYLANTPLDRVDVFSLTSGAFVGYVPVGSRPTSLAMWPRDSLGNVADTLIVANSGGTNLSVVDLTSRRELWREVLPNYQVATVKTQSNPGGGLDLIYTYYEFSDRPYQIGAMCVTSGSSKCHHVRVLYSTTPTAGQFQPFGGTPARGYLAWIEIDSAHTQHLPAHLIYEHAAFSSGSSVDTLAIFGIRDSVPGQSIVDTIVGVGAGVPITIGDLPFQDSTFVRNSGDALHSIVGEGGGSIQYARVLTYDVRPPLTPLGGSCTLLGLPISCGGTRDNGTTAVSKVTDFVVNRSSRVTGVAINYNGRTNLVRADSIYAFDWILKQTGLMQISEANGAVGMDFHPCNNFDADTRTATSTATCGASYSPSNRMVFAARPDSSLDVFDTYFYGEITDTTSTASTIPIPIRNALTGPVRVASTATSTIMFGFTARGLVVVNLPTVTNSLFPAPIASPPSGAALLRPTLVNSRPQH